MGALPLLAACSGALLAVACAEVEPRSAFAGMGTVVAYSGGGGVMATARDLGERRIAGETLKITGDCLSACTLALMPIMARSVCWTEDARFLFHAAHVGGKRHDAQTVTNYSAYPVEIQRLLPHPSEWSVNEWYAISGRDAHRALGRGECKEIG